MLEQLNTTMVEWLNDRHELINYNEDGELINTLPPILYDIQDQINFVDELLQRRLE